MSDKPKKLPPLLSVVWQDAFSIDEWTDLDELGDTPHWCRSVGWLVKDTPDFISLAGTISEDAQGCCIINIPKGWIKERKRLDRP